MLLPVVFALWTVAACGDGRIHRIGVPSGTAGIIVRYVLAEKMGSQTIEAVGIESYTLYDCCAGAAQYALGSAHLDMAVLCPDAAEGLVSKDPRYVIIGPVTLNSDIFVMRPNTISPAIAVSQKRTYQHRLVTQRFGMSARPVPMMHSGVPFAYAKGVVQGAVIDIAKAFNMKGDYLAATDNGRDVCTYVLVSKESLTDRTQYHRFRALYEKAVQEMEVDDNLLRLLKTYLASTFTRRELVLWKKMNVRFTNPFTHRPQEKRVTKSGLMSKS